MAPDLALQIASKFRMSSFNLVVFAYAHRLFLNINSPAELRPSIDRIPQTNPLNQLNKKRLTNILRSKTLTANDDEQFSSIEDKKQRLIDRLLARTSHDDRLISSMNTLFRISHQFRVDSSQLLISNGHTMTNGLFSIVLFLIRRRHFQRKSN